MSDTHVETGDPTLDNSGFDEPQSDPKTESRAREMGWVPEQEWKGEPPRNGFKSAEDFLRHGEEVLPVVRSQLKRKEEELRKLSDEFGSYKREAGDKLTRLERMSSVALEQQRTQLLAKFAERKEAAVESADTDKYRQIAKEEREALADLDDKLKEPERKETKTDALPAPVKETIDAWVADNRWYDSDPEMMQWAQGYHLKLTKEKPGMTLAENLAEVSKRARKMFPEAFGVSDDDTSDDPPPRGGSRVEGGSRVAGAVRGSAWSKLPAEARAQADKFIKDDGLFLEKGETVEKDLNKARERYAAMYEA